MTITWQKVTVGIAMVVVVLLVGFGLWFMLLNHGTSATPTLQNGVLVNPNSQSFSTGNTNTQGGSTPTVQGGITGSSPQQKIFKLANGRAGCDIRPDV
jgi:hypothetical protein